MSRARYARNCRGDPYERILCGRTGDGTLAGMSRLPEHAGRPAGRGPRVSVILRSSQRATEVRIRVSWCCRLSVPAAARLLTAAALVLAASAIAALAHDELARGVLYSLAGFLTAVRPRRP